MKPNGIVTLFSSFLMLLMAARICVAGNPLDNWQWLSPAPSGNSYSSVTYANGHYVAVGDAGAIINSTDGTNWTLLLPPPTTNALNAIGFGNGNFIAVGAGGTILLSSDTTNWTAVTSGITTNLYGVAFGAGLFVADGDGGTILTSPDATNWTAAVSPTITNLYWAIYDTNGFRLGNIYAYAALLSPDGLTWSTTTNRGVSAITYGGMVYGSNNLYVLAGNANATAVRDGFIETSPDGTNWTRQYFGQTGIYTGMTCGSNGLYVTVGENGNLLTSPDGTNWTFRSVGTDGWMRYYHAAYCNGIFCVTSNGPNILASTNNGRTWTNLDMSPYINLPAFTSIAYGNGKYVAVGSNTIIMVSTNAQRWNYVNSGSATLQKITFLNNQFLTVGDDQVMMSSKDGYHWTNANASYNGLSSTLSASAYGNGHYVVVGADSPAIYTSTNLPYWNNLSSSNFANHTFGPSNLFGVAFGNNTFVAVGSGTILTSTDSTNWTRIPNIIPTNTTLYDITFAQGMFMAVGQLAAVYPASSVLLTSPDGTNWMTHNSGTSNILRGVTYGNDRFLIAGDHSTIKSCQPIARLTPAAAVLQPNRTLQWNITGTPGQNYPIQTSTDLSNWTLYTNVTATGNGSCSFTDTNNTTQRFYRGVSQ